MLSKLTEAEESKVIEVTKLKSKEQFNRSPSNSMTTPQDSRPYLPVDELTLYWFINYTSGRGRLWGPALGVVKTLHTDNKQHKENMKT